MITSRWRWNAHTGEWTCFKGPPPRDADITVAFAVRHSGTTIAAQLRALADHLEAILPVESDERRRRIEEAIGDFTRRSRNGKGPRRAG